MVPLRRFLLLLLLTLVAVCWSSAQAEEVKLREHAVHLMEVANAVSLPGGLGNYRQAVTFRVHEPDGSVREGAFTRISGGHGAARRIHLRRLSPDCHRLGRQSSGHANDAGAASRDTASPQISADCIGSI